METATIKEWSLNGELEYDFPMLNGKYHGIQRRWWPNGNIRYYFIQIYGQVQGIEEVWNRDKSRDEIIQAKNGRIHGSSIKFKYK